MAYQLSDIVSKVQRRVRDTGYSSSEITDYINDTQNDVFNEYVLRFMRTSQTYTVTVGVADITNGSGLPADLSQVIELVNTTTGQEATIDYLDADELGDIYPDPFDTTKHANGQPQYWTWDGSQIKLFPAPAGAYTLSLRYTKKPTTLSGNSDVPQIPSEFEEILVLGASARVLEAKDNYDQAAVRYNQFDRQVAQFVKRYSMTQSGQVLQMPINRSKVTKRSTTYWRR